VNFYVVGEGNITEKQVYRHWIPFANPNLTYVSHISEIRDNNFAIISGGGHPHYLDIIERAIEDVNVMGNIDRLVIAVDSGELSYEEKKQEVLNYLARFECRSVIKLIIQHFCLEVWALGNQVAVSPKPQNGLLREYLRLFNVRIQDPELLPANERESLNREQFAKKYLKHALNDKYKGLTYSISNPKALLHVKYFTRVKQRYEKTSHIQSFENFLDAFI
jgi:hypothetical protein